MNEKKFISLKKMLPLRIIYISLMVAFAAVSSQIIYEVYKEKKSIEKTILDFNQTSVPALSQYLWDMNYEAIQTHLNSLHEIKEIVSAKIIDDTGKIIYEMKNSKNKFNRIKSHNFNLNSTVNDNKLTIGEFNITYTYDFIISNIIDKIIIIALTQTIKTFIVSFFLMLMFEIYVTRHLVYMSNYLKNFDLQGKEKKQLTIKRNSEKFHDELDILAKSINQITELICLHNVKNEEVIEMKNNEIYQKEEAANHSARLAGIGEMAASVAHEINNPLTILSSCSTKLKRISKNDPIHNEVNEVCTKIDSTILRIVHIIQSLKNLSRNADSDPFESIPISEILVDVLGLTESKTKSIGVKVEVDYIDCDASFNFDVRRVQLAQVLINLLNNSIDAIHNDSSPWVKIEFSVNADKLNISIIDSGTGIPLELQKKIMEPFFTTKAVGKGTGLGLSLTKKIIASHNGDFYVDNNCPNTKFVISIPIRQPHKTIES